MRIGTSPHFRRAAFAGLLVLLSAGARAERAAAQWSARAEERIAREETEDESGRIEARVRWYLERHGDREHIDPERQRARVTAEYARWRAEATARRLKPQGVGGTEWISLGPTNGAGRMTAIAPMPGAAGTAYAGAAGGGVWKTTDGGVTWTPLTDGLHDLAVGAIALAPSNPSILYVGTGEGGVGSAFIPGIGLLKSMDGGATWILPDSVLATSFYRILVHPTNPNELLAGTSGGAYRSSDGGASWTNVLPRSTWGDIPDIVRDPANPQVLYATTWCVRRDCTVQNGRILKSSDGGVTWTERSSGLPPGRRGFFERTSIAISESNPSVLYAARAFQDLNTGDISSHIFKTTDGALTWNEVPGLSADATFSHYLGNQSWYDNALAVSPANPDVLIAGGVRYVRTLDGGATFSKDLDLTVHADCHDLRFQGSTLWIANDGGVWTSTDQGRSAVARNTTLVTRQFFALALDAANPDRIIAGAMDNGTVQRIGTGTVWRLVQGGDGGEAAVHPFVPGTAWFSSQGAQIYRTRNASSSSTPATQLVAPPLEPEEFAPLQTLVVLDRRETQTLYTGSWRVWKSPDGGDTWTPLPTVTTDGTAWDPSDSITSIALPSVESPLMLAANLGGVFRSADRGRTWTVPRGFPDAVVTHLEFDPRDATRAWASIATTIGPSVYRSDDGGVSWIASASGLPLFAAQTIRVDPTDSTDLFCGTDVGVYRSTNSGQTWSRFGTGLPSASVHDVAILSDGSVVRAATYGRGIWELRVPPTGNSPPVATISDPGADLSVSAGTTLQLTGTVADPDPGDSASGTWFFGDDASEVPLPPGGGVTHTFRRGGVFPVSLLARDSRGSRAIATVMVSVREPADACATPEVIPGAGPFPYTIRADNQAGTVEEGDPTPACFGPNGRNGSTWFEFTPAASGTYRFSPCGTNTPTLLSVYTGAACGPYAAIPQACRAGARTDWNCDDPASTSYVAVAASAGQTLRILLSTNAPGAGGLVPLTVTLPGTAVDAPRVMGVTESAGPPAGGTSVIVIGSGFTDRALVSFGGVAASEVLVSGAHLLTARVPPHAAGPVDVVVTVPGVGTGTLKNGFRYENPPPSPCVPGAATLCLNGGRFRAEARWRVVASGESGQASAVPLTGDTGYFWFFSANNIELVLKVVDGRAVNGKFWVFYGALSNVEYEITVTDSQTGQVRVYNNASGQLASVADTAAF